jgi:hypothetical protein
MSPLENQTNLSAVNVDVFVSDVSRLLGEKLHGRLFLGRR